MSRIIKVFEHDAIYLGDSFPGGSSEDAIVISQKHLDLLGKYNEKHGRKHFTLVPEGVKFNQYVGVVQAGNLTIEILPKIDRYGDDNKDLWQKVLFYMLKECLFVRMESVSEAQLKYRSNSLLDLYFQEYINEVRTLLHKGLAKRYRSRSGNVLALKGSLQFAQNISRNLVHKERFYTTHQVYDHEHLLNQILRRALEVLQLINVNPLLTDQINRTLLDFPELPETKISTKNFGLLKFDRKTERYKKAVEIAKMILLHLSPDVRGGDNQVFALLFDMNRIWEEYIYRQIRKEIPSATRQNVTSFWNPDINYGINGKTIRPDIICESAVIDTKWKTFDLDSISDGDLQQMFIYNSFKVKDHAFLLYPGKETKIHVSGTYSFLGKRCTLATINPIKDGRLNSEVGTEIKKLIETKLL
ncbi:MULTISPECIES: McrC family protein [unclassified Imperialibacter]|uniref:McrC family protein n=1 Tax=unclassified Imperialibacter TaxID=2629706 RepID=UPI001255C51E|nr:MULTISPECIES: restriction endonuclease [unclassified Imperialibacter]CAD5257305.1 conserved hypothetical protein [Imperialibacter sp. 89]CAD5272303.1 conserved hypothetical protein [Imperialibacter sp. 75]VVT32085.1 conserved hypothetical protein [Imperialibacter sp. EC-SDR9]